MEYSGRGSPFHSLGVAQTRTAIGAAISTFRTILKPSVARPLRKKLVASTMNRSNTQRESPVPSTLSTIFFFVGIFSYLAVRTAFKLRLASTAKSVSKATLADMSLVVFVGLSQVGIPLLVVASPAFSWANYQLPAFSLWLGTALMVVGVWLFWRSHTDLGKNWSVTLELAQDHQLVTQGVYSTIRHPMYASFFLMALAQAALLPNWLSGWSALVAVSVLYLVRKPHEEAMMLSHFGREYKAYMLKSGGILPHLYGKRDA